VTGAFLFLDDRARFPRSRPPCRRLRSVDLRRIMSQVSGRP